jgi:protein-disulfide isomerase
MQKKLAAPSLASACCGVMLAALPALAWQQPAQPPAAPAQQSVPSLENRPPAAPAPTGDPKFPAVDPANFTAPAPTPDTVNHFLYASWGYDQNRVWQVQAILKTPVAGLSKVVVLVGEKGKGPQFATLQFFALPDGKHLISNDDLLPFGDKPFAENRAVLLARANGPWQGMADKSLLLVAFADFECPHCQSAQATMARLRADFPTAHFVFENFPLSSIHPEAYKAAAYSVCAAKLGGNGAFFRFADAVFENQAGLTAESADATLKAAATKAGVDAEKVSSCSGSDEAKAAVEASSKLAEDLGVTQTPYLFVNGRGLPAAGLTYDALKSVIQFEIDQDKPAAR